MSDNDKKLGLWGYLARALKRWWLATPFERAAFARERRLDCVNVGTACASIVKGWQPRREPKHRHAPPPPSLEVFKTRLPGTSTLAPIANVARRHGRRGAARR
jgi:hypothetical protein